MTVCDENITVVGDMTFTVQADGSIRVERAGACAIDQQRALIALVRDHAALARRAEKAARDAALAQADSSERWYVIEPEGFELFDTEDEARQHCQVVLDHYADNASSDGWPEEISRLQWGRLEPSEVASIHVSPNRDDSDFDEYWEVVLVPPLRLVRAGNIRKESE